MNAREQYKQEWRACRRDERGKRPHWPRYVNPTIWDQGVRAARFWALAESIARCGDGFTNMFGRWGIAMARAAEARRKRDRGLHAHHMFEARNARKLGF